MLAGLALVAAVPRSALAQSCTGGVTYATPETIVTGTKTEFIRCSGLSQGLTLKIEPGTTLGSANARIAPTGGNPGALYIGAGQRSGGSAGSNDISITNRGSIWTTDNGIAVVRDGTGDIRVDHLAGTIDASRIGISMSHSGTAGDLTLTLGDDSMIKAGEVGVDIAVNGTNIAGNATLTHNGRIEAGSPGLLAEMTGTGNVTITTGEKSSIVSGAGNASLTGRSITGGIYASVVLESHTGFGATRTGTAAGTITIDHKGAISAKREGIHARNRVAGSDSAITITTGVDPAPETPSITADRQGIRLLHEGDGTFAITILGTVMGDKAYTSTNTSKYAGVYIEVKSGDTTRGGGGTIVVGPQAHVSSGSGIAIEVADYAGHVEMILDQDSDGYVGHIEGKILSANAATTGTLTLYTRMDGTKTQLDPGDTVLRRKTMGVYTEEVKAELKTITGGFQFEDVAADTTATPGAASTRRYQNRARLYEAVPAVLAGLMDPVPYSTRMMAPRLITGEAITVAGSKGESVVGPRSSTGVWVRLEAREGKRRATTSTTATGRQGQLLAWDVDQTSIAAGVDMPTEDEDLRVGLSAHYQQSKATVAAGGRVEATGAGLGLSLTWTGESGLYVDGQLSYTGFTDIKMVSSTNGLITSGGKGTGMAVGVEVGQPIPVGAMIVTPRGGLSWSSVDMEAFAEPSAIENPGTVAPGRAESVQGRAGVLIAMAPTEANARLHASLDLEHEFEPELEVMAAGTRLTAEVKPTWVRAGVGGSMPLGDNDTTVLAGDVFYATAGSGNTEFGGGIALTIRF